VSEVDDLPVAMRDLAETLRINTLMDVELEIDTPWRGRLNHAQALGLFHIAQEALNNVSKHSRATAVSIRLTSRNGCAEMEVVDNGTGFETSGASSTERHGLRNIKDRARSLDANLLIESAVGAGTTVRVELPLSGEENSGG
jgi:two-component system NarL family sensor kinase